MTIDHRQDLQDHDEDDERLEDLDPPGLVDVDVGERRTVMTCAPPRGRRRRATLAPSSATFSSRKTVPAGMSLRTATVALHARAVRRRPSTFSPCWTPRRCGVGGRQLGALAGGEELQRGRDLDLGRGPDRAERARGAGGRWPRGAGVGSTPPATGARPRTGTPRRRRARASARRARRSRRASARRRTARRRRAG